MKKLFTDNRTAGILRMLGTKSGLTVAVMAEQLGVSERTIRNDIRQLNEDLAGSASIEGVQGRYSLRIFDPAAYKKIRHSFMGGWMNIPTALGRKISVGGYKLSQKIFSFN